MNDVETKVRGRMYQSPSRARGALARSGLGKNDKRRVATLIDLWENEGTVDHVVAGEPAPAVEVVEQQGRAATDGSGLEGVEIEDLDGRSRPFAPRPEPLEQPSRMASADVNSAYPFNPPERGERRLVLAHVYALNFNARVRVRLTIAGVAKLHAARDRVAIPPDLLESGGVWITELWELAATLGPHLFMGMTNSELLVANNRIEVLDPWETP